MFPFSRLRSPSISAVRPSRLHAVCVKRGVTGSDLCGCNSCGKGRRTEDEAETGSGEAGTDFGDGDSSDDHGGLTPDTINRANCCTNPKTK
jgi:hypothetical protein